MAVQLCLHKGLAVREPSPNASASPSPTTMRCSWRVAASEEMAQGFQGSLDDQAPGMLSRRSPVSARRWVPRSGRAASPLLRSTRLASKPPEPTTPTTSIGLPVRSRKQGPARSRFRCGVVGSRPIPCLHRPGIRDYRGLTGQDWKASEALIGAMREDVSRPTERLGKLTPALEAGAERFAPRVGRGGGGQ